MPRLNRARYEFMINALAVRNLCSGIASSQIRSLELPLQHDLLATLLQFVASVTPDGLNCDGCLSCVPELAESQLGDQPRSEILGRVQNHLDNCRCCRNEYRIFLRSLTLTEQNT